MSGLRLFYVCIFIVLSTFIHTVKSFEDNDDFWGLSFVDKNGDNNAENKQVEEGSHQNMQHTDDAANTEHEQQNVVNGSEHHADNTEELKKHEEHGEGQSEHNFQQINNEIENSNSNNNNNNNNNDNTPEHNPLNQVNNSDMQESNNNDMSHQNATTENEHNTEQISTEQIPTEQASTEQVPAGQAPTEQVPAGQAPTEQVPAGQAPTEQVPTEQAPTEQVPTEQVPTEQVPTEKVPTEQAPAEQGHSGEDEGEHSAEGDEINKNNNSKVSSDTSSDSSFSLDSNQFSDTTSSSSSGSGYSNLRKPVFGNPVDAHKEFLHNGAPQGSSNMLLYNYGANTKKNGSEVLTDIGNKGLDSISDPHKYNLLKRKSIYLTLLERAIFEIMDSSKKGLSEINGMRNNATVSKIYMEALKRLKMNHHSLGKGLEFITLEQSDKILSEMFKILTELSYDNFPEFYRSMNINKSALSESFKEIRIKIFKKIGVSYAKLPPIIKGTSGNKCPINDLIISITPKELSQRLSIMFSSWLAFDEYGALEDFENNVELNVLCSGASILMQQWKYYQNILGFEDNNDHAFLSLIDELLTIDKKYSKNEEHSKTLEKIKKSKVFNYCTKLMRTSGNISTIPFNHENNKTPSSSIIGSLGNLVKAHISRYYAATAQRINSYFNYSDKKNKKKTLPKVISICTLLNLTDILFNCTDPHSTYTPNLNLLKLNVLNTKGKAILDHLNNLNYLLDSENEAIKEICNSKNDVVDKTLQKLLILISSHSHEVLANEVEKKGLGPDYINSEIKNIDDSDHDSNDEGEDDVEKAIFDDL